MWSCVRALGSGRCPGCLVELRGLLAGEWGAQEAIIARTGRGHDAVDRRCLADDHDNRLGRRRVASRIAIAFWPARVAARKGHSFIGYFCFSLIFFSHTLIVADMVQDRTATA